MVTDSTRTVLEPIQEVVESCIKTINHYIEFAATKAKEQPGNGYFAGLLSGLTDGLKELKEIKREIAYTLEQEEEI